MFLTFIALSILLLTILNFHLVKNKFINNIKNYQVNSYKLPVHYGLCSAIWFAIIAICTLIVIYSGLLSQNQEQLSNYVIATIIITIFIICSVISVFFLSSEFKPRSHLEKISKIVIIIATTFSIVITVMIVFSILFEAIKFFKEVSVFSFLFGTNWSPQSDNVFGAVPIFVGTFLITAIAMIVAVPIGLYSAIFLSEYASRDFRKYVKPAIEILAGIPTVVYGYFAAFVVAPMIRDMGITLGLDVSLESALATGIVMGVMIVPFILSLSDDVINAVPTALRDASYALGCTKSETIKHVVIPAALPGIMGSILLAISRAIGETMIVTMAAGLAANMTFNPLAAVTTATAQMVSLLTGDQEFNSSKTLSAFALGLVLFIITLTLNIIALMIVKRYREKYE